MLPKLSSPFHVTLYRDEYGLLSRSAGCMNLPSESRVWRSGLEGSPYKGELQSGLERSLPVPLQKMSKAFDFHSINRQDSLE